MKKSFHFLSILYSCILILFVACNGTADKPTPEPPKPEDSKVLLDLWIPIGEYELGGYSKHIVRRIAVPTEEIIDVNNKGVDVSAKLYPYFARKAPYYYEISKDNRFGKYLIHPEKLEVVKEIAYASLAARKFCYAFMPNNKMVLMGRTLKADVEEVVHWSIIDLSEMKIKREGNLNLPAPPKGYRYNTAGMLTYRVADNSLLYFFEYTPIKRKEADEDNVFYLAYISPEDMMVKNVSKETRAHFPASTSYGELRQHKGFFDEKGDYYLACNSIVEGARRTVQHASLLRVKRGEKIFDPSYNGYPNERGKIVTLDYLGNRKALLYMQDPMYTLGEDVWNNKTHPYAFYFMMLDLDTAKLTDLSEHLPFTLSNFSQYVAVKDSKAYIASVTSNAPTKIIEFDPKTMIFKEVATLKEGLVIDRLEIAYDFQ